MGLGRIKAMTTPLVCIERVPPLNGSAQNICLRSLSGTASGKEARSEDLLCPACLNRALRGPRARQTGQGWSWVSSQHYKTSSFSRAPIEIHALRPFIHIHVNEVIICHRPFPAVFTFTTLSNLKTNKPLKLGSSHQEYFKILRHTCASCGENPSRRIHWTDLNPLLSPGSHGFCQKRWHCQSLTWRPRTDWPWNSVRVSLEPDAGGFEAWRSYFSLHCWSLMVCDEHLCHQKPLFTSVPPHTLLPQDKDFILFYFVCTSHTS